MSDADKILVLEAFAAMFFWGALLIDVLAKRYKK